MVGMFSQKNKKSAFYSCAWNSLIDPDEVRYGIDIY